MRIKVDLEGSRNHFVVNADTSSAVDHVRPSQLYFIAVQLGLSEFQIVTPFVIGYTGVSRYKVFVRRLLHGAYVDLCVLRQQHTASFDIVIRAEHFIAVVIVILTVILGVDERRFSVLSRRFAVTQPSQIVYITAVFSQVFGADYILLRYRQVLPCQLFAIFAQSESGYRQIEPGVLSAVADAPCVVQDKAHSHIFFAACDQRRIKFCFEIIAFGNR